jgi:hypothetical protein
MCVLLLIDAKTTDRPLRNQGERLIQFSTAKKVRYSSINALKKQKSFILIEAPTVIKVFKNTFEALATGLAV